MMRARGGGFRTARTARRCSADDARPCAASSRRSGSYVRDTGRYGEIWGDMGRSGSYVGGLGGR